MLALADAPPHVCVVWLKTHAVKVLLLVFPLMDFPIGNPLKDESWFAGFSDCSCEVNSCSMRSDAACLHLNGQRPAVQSSGFYKKKKNPIIQI